MNLQSTYQSPLKLYNVAPSLGEDFLVANISKTAVIFDDAKVGRILTRDKE